MDKKAIKKSKIIIQMDNKFEKFDGKQKKDFKKDLKSITNDEQLEKHKFEGGCVLFSGILNEASVDRLVRVHLNKKNKKHCAGDIDTLKFIKKYSILDIGKFKILDD